MIIGHENWVPKVGTGNLALFCVTGRARSLLVGVCWSLHLLAVGR